jgi:hypothetical protein
MFPTHYTTDSAGKITFHYDKQEYKDWYKRGDAGHILAYMEGSMLTYWSMVNGTKYSISFKHFPLWDGPVQPPEYYLKETAQPRMQKAWDEMWSRMKLVKPEEGHPDAWKHLKDLNITQGT